MNARIRYTLAELGHENALLFEDPDFDECIIGVTSDGQAIYDYDSLIDYLVEQGNTEDEAIDYVAYILEPRCNTAPNTPIIMQNLRLE